MDVEHSVFLSWFSGRGESHEQDGETLSRSAWLRVKSASGDPAMAFGPSIDTDGRSFAPASDLGSVLCCPTQF
jgi:hypothetical protein